MKFKFEIKYKRGKDKSFGTYFVSRIDGTPFIAQGLGNSYNTYHPI